MNKGRPCTLIFLLSRGIKLLTGSQQFISLSEFNPERNIFTAAISKHSGAAPCPSLFISVGVRPIDFDFFSFFFLKMFLFHPDCMDFSMSHLPSHMFLRAD